MSEERHIFINRGNSTVSFYLHYVGPEGDVEKGYLYYSLREAIQKLRKELGVRYKRIAVHDCR